MCNQKNFKKIKRFIFGGEGFPIEQLKKLYNIYGDKKIYSNVYGPTECTCICSSYDVKKKDINSKIWKTNIEGDVQVIAKNFVRDLKKKNYKKW